MGNLMLLLNGFITPTEFNSKLLAWILYNHIYKCILIDPCYSVYDFYYYVIFIIHILTCITYNINIAYYYYYIIVIDCVDCVSDIFTTMYRQPVYSIHTITTALYIGYYIIAPTIISCSLYNGVLNREYWNKLIFLFIGHVGMCLFRINI